MFSLESALYGLAGGALIGTASLLASGATGKIPGISGMCARVLQGRPGDRAWRALFLGGLICGAALAFAFSERAADYQSVRPLAAMAAAGILVGLGTRIGGGCTSGHGICGLGLGSRDSLIATLLFMVTGMLTAFGLSYFAGGFLRG